MNEQRQFDILDILNILSFLIVIENLQENRNQSVQNDVNAANDKQAHELLQAMDERFGRIEKKLDMLLKGKNRV